MGSVTHICGGGTQSPKKLPEKDVSLCGRLDFWLTFLGLVGTWHMTYGLTAPRLLNDDSLQTLYIY